MVKLPSPEPEAEQPKAPAKKATKKAAKRPAKAVAQKATKKVANRPKVASADTPLKADEPKAKPRAKVETHALEDDDEKLRVLYYGEPGAGKTTATLRAADFGKVVVINAERGLKARALRRAGVNIDNIEVYDGEISYEALEDLYFQLKQRMADGEEIFAIVWDSITMTVPWLVERAVAEGVEKARKLKRVRAETDVYVEDYGTMTEQMKRLVTRRFMDLDCHLIVTCLAKRDKDDSGAVRLTPDVTPALGATLSGAMDMVLAMRSDTDENGDTQRDAISVAMERYQAKDRLGVLPSILVDPGFDRVLAYAEETLIGANDPLQGGSGGIARPKRIEVETEPEFDNDDEEDET